MALYNLDGVGVVTPASGQFWVAPNAILLGKVKLEHEASVWFGAVLRGDNEWIEIGEGSNVQDNCTCHTDPGFPLTIGTNCTVGHNVILHGCTLEDDTLVGMGSIVMASRQLNSSALPIPCFLSFESTPVGPKKLGQVASWQANPRMLFCLMAMKQEMGCRENATSTSLAQ